jgi:hypothetical protein
MSAMLVSATLNGAGCGRLFCGEARRGAMIEDAATPNVATREKSRFDGRFIGVEL